MKKLIILFVLLIAVSANAEWFSTLAPETIWIETLAPPSTWTEMPPPETAWGEVKPSISWAEKINNDAWVEPVVEPVVEQLTEWEIKYRQLFIDYPFLLDRPHLLCKGPVEVPMISETSFRLIPAAEYSSSNSVPEPTTMVLLGSGMIFLALWKRKNT